MQILGYFILVFGVVGIGLGMYGLFMPSARRRGFSLSLPRPRLPGRGSEDVDQLIAELEQSGFRNSPFEAKAPAPKIAKPSLPAAKGPGAAPRPRAAVPLRVPARPRLDEHEDEDEDLLPPPPIMTTYDDEEEELDPVVAELLAEVQAAQNEAALGAESLEDIEGEDAAEEEPEEPVAPEADPLSGDMRDLFAETTVESKTSEALRNAIPEVKIEELLAQAREMRALFAEQANRNRVA